MEKIVPFFEGGGARPPRRYVYATCRQSVANTVVCCRHSVVGGGQEMSAQRVQCVRRRVVVAAVWTTRSAPDRRTILRAVPSTPVARPLRRTLQVRRQHPQQQSPRPTSSSSSTVTGVTTLHSAMQETQPATFYNLSLTH